MGKLLEGTYSPSPVRRVEIPKPNGGVRLLGIPTVLDRMLQQAIATKLSEIYEPTFLDNSYGFRPKRSAGMDIKKAEEYINEGYKWVVDMDLEKFFDNNLNASHGNMRIQEKAIGEYPTAQY